MNKLCWTELLEFDSNTWNHLRMCLHQQYIIVRKQISSNSFKNKIANK